MGVAPVAMAAQDPLVWEEAPGCSPRLLKLVGGGPGGHHGAGGKVPPRAGEESFITSIEKDEKKGWSQRGKRTQREAAGMRPVDSTTSSRGDTQYMYPPIQRRGTGYCGCQVFNCWVVRRYRTPREREPQVGILGTRRPGEEAISQPVQSILCFYSQHCPTSSVSVMREGLIKPR